MPNENSIFICIDLLGIGVAAYCFQLSNRIGFKTSYLMCAALSLAFLVGDVGRMTDTVRENIEQGETE
jgi:hypothetical protein